jgi:hypothetical protein
MRVAAITLLLLFYADSAFAEKIINTDRGQILKSSGDVYVRDQQGIEHIVDTPKFTVHETDTIVTKEGSKAVVQLNDGALSVLDENSSLLIKKSGWLSYLGGKIYFTFHKVFAEPRHIDTPFSIIGIRGTTFIVYTDKTGGAVALQEGRLEMESPAQSYELHISRELKDFEAFKKQAQDGTENMRHEFDDYKKQINQEFVEYRKSFILQANRVARFSGHRVDETSMNTEGNAELGAEFGSFEQEAGELLQQFRGQVKKQREKQPVQAPDDF